MTLIKKNSLAVTYAIVLLAFNTSCDVFNREEEQVPEPQALFCPVENQIPVSFIFDRLDVNTAYRFLSCYHTPLDVVLSDTTTCIFPANKYYDEESYGFYFMGIDDLYQDRLFGANIHGPRWSNDGNWLVWSNFEDIFKAPFNRDSLNYDKFVRLTDDLSFLQEPIWSTNDQHLLIRAVSADPESVKYGREGYYIISANGGDPVFIEDAEGKPVWINEAEVLFLSKQEMTTFNFFSGSYKRVAELNEGFANVNRPRLSPSRDQILFLAQKESDQYPHLYEYDLVEQSIKKRSQYPMLDFALIDNSSLIYTGIQNRVTTLYQLDLATDSRSFLYSYTER